MTSFLEAKIVKFFAPNFFSDARLGCVWHALSNIYCVKVSDFWSQTFIQPLLEKYPSTSPRFAQVVVYLHEPQQTTKWSINEPKLMF